MSSHHIIREDQEPALLIMDANGIPFEQVQELLEWSPTVVVAEHALAEVLSWGIKIDVAIVTNLRASSWTTSLQDQLPVKIISCNAKDEILATALYFLQASKQKGVNIVSAEKLELFEPFSGLDLSVFQSDKRWSFIRNGLYEKWLPAGRTLQVYPFNEQAEIETKQDGAVTISLGKGFWVSEK